MTKNAGKQFETDFIQSFPLDMFTYRLRDSAGAWQGTEGGGKSKSRFTPTNICDFICHSNGKTFLLELKSTQSKSMSFTNLKGTQIMGLYNASNFEGIVCYFIFNFRTLEETYAIEAKKVKEYIEMSDRKSFPIDWVRKEGLLIPQKKKKVHYRYDTNTILH